MPAPEFVEMLRRERESMIGQIADLEQAVTAISNLLALYDGQGTAIPKRKVPPVRPRTPNRARGRAAQYDWDRGRRLWDAGKTAKEIAAELGCATQSVKNVIRRHNWPRRDTLATRKTVSLTRCPNCEKMTTLNPCENCHTTLPSGMIGKH